MPAKSPGFPHRPAGVLARTRSFSPSICFFAAAVRSVSIQPGRIALTWMPSPAHAVASAFVCSKLAYPALKASGNGKVINIGSMMSIFGASFATAYAASKGGIVQYTRACANAWAPDNIQVNAILPGWIDTDLTRGARQQVSGLHERVLARTPAGRWGDVDDFAGIAVFLASSASNFVTGTAIPVDGGFSVMA